MLISGDAKLMIESCKYSTTIFPIVFFLHHLFTGFNVKMLESIVFCLQRSAVYRTFAVAAQANVNVNQKATSLAGD